MLFIWMLCSSRNIKENSSTKPLKVSDVIASKRKRSLGKKLADGSSSDVKLIIDILKAGLAQTIWPQKAALQACDGRNFYFEPTLLCKYSKDVNFE